MSALSPGPWRLTQEGKVLDARDKTVANCAVMRADHAVPRAEREANVLAIAALPELLTAARAALDEMCHTTAPRSSFTEAVDALDAALAKATPP